MATESGGPGAAYDGRLFELYTRYVSEPESKRDVYGYALLVVGYLLAVGGILAYLVGPTGSNVSPDLLHTVRRLAAGPAAAGLALTLMGLVLTLPVNRRSLYVAMVGTAMALVAVALFLNFYPYNWHLGTPSYSEEIIALYGVGVGLIAGVVIMVPVVTGERSYFSETTVGHENEHPDIMVGESDRGGLFAVYRDHSEWAWRFIDQSAVAASTSSFLSRLEAEERVESVKDQVASAGLLEIKHAAFRLYESHDDSWLWYLMSADGTALAEVGREFETRGGAEDSINVMKDHGPDAEVMVVDDAAYDVFNEDGEWGWRLLDEDRRSIAAGVERHTDDVRTVRDLEQFRELAGDASELVVESYGIELVEDAGRWRWQLRENDHTRLARSVRDYDSKGAVESGVYDTLDRLQRASTLEAGTPTFDVYEDDGRWRWRFVDDGGRPVVVGRHEAADAETAEDAAHELRAQADHADVVTAPDLAFETYRTADGWRWRLVTSDREVRAESVRTYDSAESASALVERVREEAPDADLIEFDTAAFQVYEAEGGAWRWRLIDEDGTVLADSGQGEYESKDDAMSAMVTLQENAPEAEHLEIENAAFELFEDDDGWGWRLVDDIGDTIAEGSRRHASEADARGEMDDLVEHVRNVDERQMAHGAFQVYDDDRDQWWWRFVLPDGSIHADGPDSFGTRHAAEDAVEDIIAVASDAPVEVVGQLAVVLDPSDWSWELVDEAREPVAVGTRTYDSRGGATTAIDDLRSEASETTVYEIRVAAFDCYETDDGWTWQLVDDTHEPIARAAEQWESLEGAERAVRAVRNLAPHADVLEYDDVAFEVVPAEDGWTWKLVDEDQSTIAVGPGTYETREAVSREIEAVRREITGASVIEIDSAAFEFHHTDEGWRWRLVDDAGSELATSVQAFDTRSEAQSELSTVKDLGPAAWTSVAE